MGNHLFVIFLLSIDDNELMYYIYVGVCLGASVGGFVIVFF